MNYEQFFNNPDRSWEGVLWELSPPEARSSDGYLLAWEYDVRHGSYLWNLYKFDRTAPDCYTCVAHNIPDNVIPDNLKGN